MPIFTQAAALSVSQYLSANVNRPQMPVEELASRPPSPLLPTPCVEQAASSFTVSENEAINQMALAQPETRIVARLQKHRKLHVKPALPPPAPVVMQLIEMGFPRKRVEFAAKSLGEGVLLT